MTDIKLFRIADGTVHELEGSSVSIEKSLQNLIERYLEPLLGILYLASEFQTGKSHRGRIDTLGIDENGSPVIIEYKRSLNENVINQGLFYLDWLLDHKADFKLLVLEKYGPKIADLLDWSSPRLLCIAGDFTNYDEYAVQQINRNIELIRYRMYGNELLLFERINTVGEQPITESTHTEHRYKTVSDYLEKATPVQRQRYEKLRTFLLSLGDDTQMQVLKYYIAFKRIKNFACVNLYAQNENLLVWVKVDPDSVSLEPGFMRDVRKIGHYGTGDLEITIRNDEDLERAKPLLIKSYEAS
ncbi:MAG: DUF5655 domain-containing protein [Anaerolineae bacterium]|nr:DUF5655 domain-containing protein [Anaerolineae bacterium]